MIDIIETFGFGTSIQHGKLNDRIYLMKLNKKDFGQIIDYLLGLAKAQDYSKIFCKVPAWAVPVFVSNGFVIEAQVPNFYKGEVNVFFLSKFTNQDRQLHCEHDQLTVMSQLLLSSSPQHKEVSAPSDFVFKALRAADANEISKLYRNVFESYPFPIFEPAYIRDTMAHNVQYFGYHHKGRLVAISSAEIDRHGQNAEMTDFATHPHFRGNKLALMLLGTMEQAMKSQGIATLYTIARLNSPAMNKTFLNLNYKYAGTLINNTNISGKIESMNVLYKALAPPHTLG